MKITRQWSVHLARITLLCSILLVMHLQHDRLLAIQRGQVLSQVDWSSSLAFYPESARLGEPKEHEGRTVKAADGNSLGYVLQTTPESDPFIGFSGPTNLLIAFDNRDRIGRLSGGSTLGTYRCTQQCLLLPFMPTWCSATIAS